MVGESVAGESAMKDRSLRAAAGVQMRHDWDVIAAPAVLLPG